MEHTITQLVPQIRQLMQQHGVEKAYLFGSAARGTIKEISDVNFTIRFSTDMHHTAYAENYFPLVEAPETLLQKR